MRSFPLLSLILLAPAVLLPQSVHQPHSGIVFDSSAKSFRPVMGVPGAASLGDPLAIHIELVHARTCSEQDFALAATGRRGVVALLRLDTLQLNQAPGGTDSAPNRIELSSSCSAAVLYFARSRRIQILTGLPEKPVLAASFNINLPGEISSLAVNDNGTEVLAVASGSGAYALSAASAPALLVPLAADAAVAFRGNQDAIIAVPERNSVLLVSNVAGAASVDQIAGPEQGISTPSSVWYDARSQNLLVASSTGGDIHMMHLPDGSQTVIACGCQPGEMSRLGEQTYQIAAPSPDKPLYILDTHASPPRVVFVASREDRRVPPLH